MEVVIENTTYLLNDINEDYSLHISATDGNPYLPPNYLEMNTRGKGTT